MSTGRVHRIQDDNVVPVPEPKPRPKPPAGGTPVDGTSTVMPPGVRPANSWDAMLQDLPSQTGLL